MRFDALLGARGSIRVERPPEIWEADTGEARLVPLLDEMIAAARAGGAEPGELTLNVSNVVVENEEGDEEAEARAPFPGEYVAVTVHGHCDLGPDATWHPLEGDAAGLLARLAEWLIAAGAHFAYIRRMPPTGSVTVFLSGLRS